MIPSEYFEQEDIKILKQFKDQINEALKQSIYESITNQFRYLQLAENFEQNSLHLIKCPYFQDLDSQNQFKILLTRIGSLQNQDQLFNCQQLFQQFKLTLTELTLNKFHLIDTINNDEDCFEQQINQVDRFKQIYQTKEFKRVCESFDVNINYNKFHQLTFIWKQNDIYLSALKLLKRCIKYPLDVWLPITQMGYFRDSILNEAAKKSSQHLFNILNGPDFLKLSNSQHSCIFKTLQKIDFDLLINCIKDDQILSVFLDSKPYLNLSDQQKFELFKNLTLHELCLTHNKSLEIFFNHENHQNFTCEQIIELLSQKDKKYYVIQGYSPVHISVINSKSVQQKCIQIIFDNNQFNKLSIEDKKLIIYQKSYEGNYFFHLAESKVLGELFNNDNFIKMFFEMDLISQSIFFLSRNQQQDTLMHIHVKLGLFETKQIMDSKLFKKLQNLLKDQIFNILDKNDFNIIMIAKQRQQFDLVLYLKTHQK